MINFDLRTTLEESNDILVIRSQKKGLGLEFQIDPEVHHSLREIRAVYVK